jgi:hypothetical protein
MSKVETFIVRNSSIKSLFDVVKVDYMHEDVQFLEKYLTFEQAQQVLADQKPSPEQLYSEMDIA